jgi:hypothetical protein
MAAFALAHAQGEPAVEESILAVPVKVRDLFRKEIAQAASYFASLGFSVWVPTRVGYGVSGTEEDPEYTGPCQRRDYRSGFDVSSAQVLQVIEHAKRRAASGLRQRRARALHARVRDLAPARRAFSGRVAGGRDGLARCRTDSVAARHPVE